jgi:hypothetical protein
MKSACWMKPGTGNFEDDDFVFARNWPVPEFHCSDVFIHHYGSRSFIGNKVDYGKSMKGNHKHFLEKWNTWTRRR